MLMGMDKSGEFHQRDDAVVQCPYSQSYNHDESCPMCNGSGRVKFHKTRVGEQISNDFLFDRMMKKLTKVWSKMGRTRVKYLPMEVESTPSRRFLVER